MRLKSLYIPDYYLLKDFEIDFNSNLSVLIGENGSGKSSVLEYIAYIFGHLYKYFVLKDKTAEFIDGYKIDYEINELEIYIESHYVRSVTNTFKPTIRINDEEMSIAQIEKIYGNFSLFLPTKVVLEYSGITERLRELNKHFEEKYIKQIVKNNNPYSLKPLNLPNANPFLYVKKEYLSFVVLALFVLDTKESNTIINQLGIDTNGCEITITLKKPYWAKKESENKYPWGISGKIAQDFIDGLSVAGITNGIIDNKISYNFYGAISIKDLFQDYFNLTCNQIVPFLDTLLCDDLLENIAISWNDEEKNTFSIERLSEGEKQLILSVGLNLVLKEKNLLLLLDEPDVSLHPKWQREFLSKLQEGLDSESMAIVTTHSPSLVSDLSSRNLHLIRDGKLVEKSLNYYGKPVEDILIDYFGLSSTRNKIVEVKINELWTLIKLGKYQSEEYVKLREELVSLLGKDDKELLAMDIDIRRKEYAKNK